MTRSAGTRMFQGGRPRRVPPLLILMTLAATITLARSADLAKPGTKRESFDHDPGWEAHNNRIVPREYPTIVQDFGYSQTTHAGKVGRRNGRPGVAGVGAGVSMRTRSAPGRSTTS